MGLTNIQSSGPREGAYEFFANIRLRFEEMALECRLPRLAGLLWDRESSVISLQRIHAL